MNKKELELWVDQEHGPEIFVFLGPFPDLPDGTPDTVVPALGRLWGQATADLKVFTDWLYAEEDPAPAPHGEGAGQCPG